MDSIFALSLFLITGLAFAAGLALAFASRRFHVQTDPRIEKMMAVLPHVNCRACGFHDCHTYAEAVLGGQASALDCPAGGEKVSKTIADIMGAKTEALEGSIAVVHCKGGDKEAARKFRYHGIADCRAAVLVAGGNKECAWGCLGLGSCAAACAFDAIEITDNGLARVDVSQCTGCGRCIEACPKGIIHLMPVSAKIFLACSNHDWGAKVKGYCTVGCTACAVCVKVTTSGTVDLEDHLPLLDYTKEENFVVAAHKCPQDCFADLAFKRPKVNIDHKCNGCTECMKICPVRGAIEGKSNEHHKVNFEKCIGCGRCLFVCPVHAIHLMGALGYEPPRRRTRQFLKIR